MTNCFKLCQWNCRSAIANKNDLENLLANENIDVALLSETWFKPNKYINFTGYNVIRIDRPDGYGGVAILLKSNIKFKEFIITQNKKCQMVGVQICTNYTGNVTLVSIYVPPKINVTVSEWNKFFESIPNPHIIGGDFNAHHVLSGDASRTTHKVTSY